MKGDSNNSVSRMKRFISEISKKIGPRPAGTKEERNGAEFISSELKKSCDNVRIDSFNCHPFAYKSTFIILSLLYLLAVVLFFINPIVSLVLIAPGLSIFFLRVIFMKEVIDFIFPKKQSSNVIAKMRSMGKAKRTIIFSAHHDSNYEFPILKKSEKLFSILSINLVVSGIILLVYLIVKLCLAEFSLVVPQIINTLLSIIFLVLILPNLYFSFNFSSTIPVIGANDNLSGCAVMVELAKQLSKQKIKDTEIWFVSFGAEEVGGIGSKRFVEKYFKEIKDSEVINIDMVGGKGDVLCLSEKELNGFVKLDKDIISKIEKVARGLKIKLEKRKLSSGTDAMSFKRKGIKATSILALNKKSSTKYYHVVEDDVGKIDFNNLNDVLSICKSYVSY
jgi:hypothetical protein